METITLDQDIKLFYITATSFPAGVMEAHKKLHALLPDEKERVFFGISRPENGPIVYRAATIEKNKGEAEKYGCETMTLKKGKYISVTINDFMKDEKRIAKAFEQLLSHEDIDPQGYCVERYSDNQKDVQCMVRLNQP